MGLHDVLIWIQFFFLRIKKKMHVYPIGILTGHHQDYKKENKKTGILWDSTKKPLKRFWDSTQKLFFYSNFCHIGFQDFFWDSGILDQKKYDFCDICDPETSLERTLLEFVHNLHR